MKSLLKLGTRKSLLAWAQSSQIARLVEKANPGVQVELVGIETQGDRILDVPLRNVEGKEFFVAEIDSALRGGKVDFTVHSLKDLSLQRPEEFALAMIPKRENPRDVIVFGPRARERLEAGVSLVIGTSSPRRLENIPSSLDQALPGGASDASKTRFEEIRGNVHTRLSRLHLAVDDAKYLDGVVLAFAGLIRLWEDEAGRRQLGALLAGVRWMIPPLAICPAAPGQGALAVECLRSAPDILACLSKLHHEETAIQVAAERALLAASGGGCHQRFGATQVHHQELGNLLFVHGKSHDNRNLREFRWSAPPEPDRKSPIEAWDGSTCSGLRQPIEVPDHCWKDLEGRSVFVAHVHALPENSEEHFSKSRVWTSGISSWFKLARRGVWVEGCAESFGFDFLVSSLQEGVLGLPPFSHWKVFTHIGALEPWRALGMEGVPTYQVGKWPEDESLGHATHVFWSSGSQFDELKGKARSETQHACGPGKTAMRIRNCGFTPLVFPSAKEWRKWLKI